MELKKSIYILLLIAIFSCCENNSILNIYEVALLNKTEKGFLGKTIIYQTQIESDNQVYYMGKVSKQIELSTPLTQTDIINYIETTQKFSHPDILKLLRIPEPHEQELKVRVDTTNLISKIIKTSRDFSFGNRSTDTILTYPVIIENVSPNFFKLLYGNQVYLTIEALNIEGEWKPITYPYQRFCGTGIYQLPLFPREIIVTSIPVIKGKRETKARIKIFEFISEEFYMSVNEEIFINPFNIGSAAKD